MFHFSLSFEGWRLLDRVRKSLKIILVYLQPYFFLLGLGFHLQTTHIIMLLVNTYIFKMTMLKCAFTGMSITELAASLKIIFLGSYPIFVNSTCQWNDLILDRGVLERFRASNCSAHIRASTPLTPLCVVKHFWFVSLDKSLVFLSLGRHCLQHLSPLTSLRCVFLGGNPNSLGSLWCGRDLKLS